MKTIKPLLFAAAVLCAALASCDDVPKDPHAIAQRFDFSIYDGLQPYEQLPPTQVECIDGAHIASADSIVYGDGYSSIFLEAISPCNSEYRFYDAKQRPIITIGQASECSPIAWVYIRDDDKLTKIYTNDDIYGEAELYETLFSVENNLSTPVETRKVIEAFVNQALTDSYACAIDLVYNDRGQLTEVTDGRRSVRAPQGEWLTAMPGKNDWFWSSDINGGFYVLYVYDKDGNEIATFPELDFEGLPVRDYDDEDLAEYE